MDLHKGKHMDSKLLPSGGKAGRGQSAMAYTNWTVLGIMVEITVN